MKFGVATLAAGASRRMGTPKLLLPWEGVTIAEALLGAWRKLGAAQIAFVTAPAPNRVHDKLAGLSGLDVIINPQPDGGMYSSVQCAAAWAGWRHDLEAIVLTLGDQPHVSHESLRQLIAFADANPGCICQLRVQDRATHPIVFPRLIFREIATSRGPTLKEFLDGKAAIRRLIASADESLLMDIDTPADYERARALAEENR